MAIATGDDIALGIREQQIEVLTDNAIRARYPNQSRDASLNPDKGYFDVAADAVTVLAARKALIGTERRRFAVEVDGLVWFDPETYEGVRLIDEEHDVDMTCLVARWEVELDAEMTRFELLG